MKRPDTASLANAAYVDELYRRYREDSSSVDVEWQHFFAGFEFAERGGVATPPASAGADPQATVSVHDLIHSYRELGHLVADLDPLGNNETSHPLLELSEFGYSEDDLDREIEMPAILGGDTATVGQLIERLRQTYSSTIGVEYMYIASKEQRSWLQERIEPSRNRPDLSAPARRDILRRLLAAHGFERFLHTKFVGQKRFSLEGGETLIPMLDAMVESSADAGVREFVVGMAHRGRINVLAHTLGKPYEIIFSEFEGGFLDPSIQGDGDVKYHLGYARDLRTAAGSDCHVSLLFNPSHLEAINPIAEGIVAGKQHYRHDRDGSQVMLVLLHGDAAFMGQGLVMETLALSELPHYHVGGTIHVILNNQVGFTTSPRDYRFTRYPTEIAKLIQAPVFHVNGNDPEAVVQAARLASEFRTEFKEDVIIDLVCYRRHGHNELDDPTFTQPVMYKRIAGLPPVSDLYADRLVDGGVVSADEVEAMRTEIRGEMDAALAYARDYTPKQQTFLFGGAWQGMAWAGDDWDADTRVRGDAVDRVVDGACRLPDGFAPHPKVERLYAERRRMCSEGEAMDWACAEMLAVGTLLLEGTTVRLSGQDSGRGTFSQRHAALYDMNTEERYVPLDHMSDGQGRFYLIDSCLSEAGVLGFEYGFSSADPRNLVVWEAQYGDFVNGAQVIIDQFLASGESKWQRMSGLVMLLPHGYEGQGPEHSSARLERFLTLSAEQNWQVCTPTTPAQYFHLLRRQVRRNFRKPLVIMSPKSMLRQKLCVSPRADLLRKNFHSVLDETEQLDPSRVRRVLLCSGKVYYDLLVGRRERGFDDVAIVRVEQLYPFPLDRLRSVLSNYPDDAEVYWVQEEPKNMGAWRFVSDRNFLIFDDDRQLVYVGRESAASPATGSFRIHEAERLQMVDEALRPSKVTDIRSRSER